MICIVYLDHGSMVGSVSSMAPRALTTHKSYPLVLTYRSGGTEIYRCNDPFNSVGIKASCTENVA